MWQMNYPTQNTNAFNVFRNYKQGHKIVSYKVSLIVNLHFLKGYVLWKMNVQHHKILFKLS